MYCSSARLDYHISQKGSFLQAAIRNDPEDNSIAGTSKKTSERPSETFKHKCIEVSLDFEWKLIFFLCAFNIRWHKNMYNARRTKNGVLLNKNNSFLSILNPQLDNREKSWSPVSWSARWNRQDYIKRQHLSCSALAIRCLQNSIILSCFLLQEPCITTEEAITRRSKSPVSTITLKRLAVVQAPNVERNNTVPRVSAIPRWITAVKPATC